jgi:hypothetical protein
MTAKQDISKEKEIRIMEISLTPAFISLFGVGFYFLYLKTIGTEVSDWFFLSSMVSVVFGSLAICLALNELLLRTYGGHSRFKRLLFRWSLMALFFSLLTGTFFSLSALLPSVDIFFRFLYGALLVTVIFAAIVIRFRHLFNRLDKGEW